MISLSCGGYIHTESPPPGTGSAEFICPKEYGYSLTEVAASSMSLAVSFGKDI
jgi:hypothetical protein